MNDLLGNRLRDGGHGETFDFDVGERAGGEERDVGQLDPFVRARGAGEACDLILRAIEMVCR